MRKTTYTVSAATGFAQLATLCVQLTRFYQSNTFLEYRGISVPVRHSPEGVMALMNLGIQPGETFHIRVEGPDECNVNREMKEMLGYSGKLRVKDG